VTSAYRTTLEALSGLVSSWRLDEASGTTITDSIGSHDGTATATGVTYAQTPLVEEVGGNTALAFDGSTGQIDVAHHADFNGTSAFSVVLWVKKTSVRVGGSDRYGLVHKFQQTSSTTGNGWGLDWSNTDRFEFYVNSTDNLNNYQPLQLDTVYMLCATFVAASTRARTYVNGRLDFEDASTATPNVTAQPVVIAGPGFGGSGSTPFLRFPGVIDEVAFFSRELTPVEVASLWEAGVATVPAAIHARTKYDGTEGVDGVTVKVFDCGNSVEGTARIQRCRVGQRRPDDRCQRRHAGTQLHPAPV
jgi:hypothetical protein